MIEQSHGSIVEIDRSAGKLSSIQCIIFWKIDGFDLKDFIVGGVDFLVDFGSLFFKILFIMVEIFDKNEQMISDKITDFSPVNFFIFSKIFLVTFNLLGFCIFYFSSADYVIYLLIIFLLFIWENIIKKGVKCGERGLSNGLNFDIIVMEEKCLWGYYSVVWERIHRIHFL